MNAITATRLLHADRQGRATIARRRAYPADAADPRSVCTLVRLSNGNVLRIFDGVGTRVTAASGLLWITEEGSLKDVVLQAGDRHQIENLGKVLVYADRRANLVLEVPADASMPRTVDVVAAAGDRGQPIALRRTAPLPLLPLFAAIKAVVRKARRAWSRFLAGRYPSAPTGGWFEHDAVHSSRRPRGAGSRRVEAPPASARDALTRSFPTPYY